MDEPTDEELIIMIRAHHKSGLPSYNIEDLVANRLEKANAKIQELEAECEFRDRLSKVPVDMYKEAQARIKELEEEITKPKVREMGYEFRRCKDLHSKTLIDHDWLCHLLTQIKCFGNDPNLTVDQLDTVLLAVEHDLWKRPEYLITHEDTK